MIGGKSMGGRMATLIADQLPVSGVCCFGYPFFPKRKDGSRDLKRVEHLQTLAHALPDFTGALGIHLVRLR